MTGYQILLVVLLALWPLAMAVLLYIMGKLENYVNRQDASTPEEAGLEPVTGKAPDREVRIVFGDKVVGESHQ